MTEYIKREKVYEMLNDLGGCGAEPDTWADGWDKAIDTAIDNLGKIPAADVREVKHDRWIKEKTSALVHWHCSVCGDCYYLDEPNAEYCPRCGAKMDGKDGNNENI